MYRTSRILAFAVAVTLCCSAAAQQRAFGLYNCLKGFGVNLEVAGADGEFVDSYTLFADIYGFPTGRTDSPGVKFNYSREFPLLEVLENNVSYSLYAGPGFSTGLVRDFEKNYYQDLSHPLEKNPGFIAALSGIFGCRFGFRNRIVLDLSFTLEAGLHIRKDESGGNAQVSLYKNGIFESFYPQLSILTCF